MCGRYVLEDWSDEAAALFGAEDAADEKAFSNWNVAPTQVMPAVAEIDGKRVVEPMKWGLVPGWSKEPVNKFATFNARSEDLFEKPTWRGPARYHRCLIPATGFYEWQRLDGAKSKQPTFIHPKDQTYFAFAGLFDIWKGELLTYSIVTTTPNKEMSAIHNRMPVILHPDDWDTWLSSSIQSRDGLEPLLRPYDDGKLEMFEVSSDVNAVRNNNGNLILPRNSQ